MKFLGLLADISPCGRFSTKRPYGWEDNMFVVEWNQKLLLDPLQKHHKNNLFMFSWYEPKV